MTREEKELLLTDLCARLPYGVIVSNKLIDNNHICKLTPYSLRIGIFLDSCYIEYTNLYLKSIKRMSKDEILEFSKLDTLNDIHFDFSSYPFCLEFVSPSQIDWLNSHHFDYRCLIEKGLALEAPEGMYSKQ